MLIMDVVQSFYGRDQAFMGVVSYVSAIRRQFFVLRSHVGSSSFVCCSESRRVRFLEVALVLQLC